MSQRIIARQSYQQPRKPSASHTFVLPFAFVRARSSNRLPRHTCRRLALILIFLVSLCGMVLAQKGKKPPRRPAAGSVQKPRQTKQSREDSLRKVRQDAIRKAQEDSLRQVREDSLQLVQQDSLWVVFERQAREDSLQLVRQDSLWEVLENQTDSSEDETTVIKHYSHGWFPQAFPAQSILITTPAGIYSDVFDQANDLRSSAFVPTTAPFSWHNPFESGERKIMQSNKNKEEDDGYPVSNFTEYGLSYRLNLPMPAIVRLDASVQITDGILFSNDTTRSYLTLSGLKRPLKEVGVVHLSQYALAGTAGLNIPFYGAFVSSTVATISSYYYLHAAIGGSYAISSKATQYVQIANVKDEIRYGNGSDTATILYQTRLSQLDRLRTSFDFALGWNFGVEFFNFFFEAYISVPTRSILKDAEWREFYGGFRLGFGYQWYPKKKNVK